MKKYLITGAFALVVSTSLISCHSDDEIYGSIVEQKVKAYEQVFEEEFGKINPNQNWGFSSANSQSRTRGLQLAAGTRNVARIWGNGNPYCDTDGKFWVDNYGYYPPAKITHDEWAAVYEEFSKVHNDLGETINFTDYFIQQVHSSKDNPKNIYHSFTNQDGNITDVKAWEHMDQLVCGLSDTHGNNFNACDDPGLIETWDGYTLGGGDGKQKVVDRDSVQLLLNCDSKRFGYLNSLDSKYHYEYIILKVNGAYYVGFDFCASYSFNTRTDNGGFVKSRYDQDPGTEKDINLNGYTAISGDEVVYNEDGTIYGYKGGDKDVHRDHIYNDWIIKITPAKQTSYDPNTENLPIDKGTTYTERTYTEYRYMTTLGTDKFGRIMCEDLGTISASDIDFNDIVFDAYIYDMIPVKRTKVTIIQNGQEYTEQEWSSWVPDNNHANLAYTSTDIYLLAGGGTIPVTVADYPLKETFGTTDDVIVNTVDDRDNSDIKRYGNPYDNTQSYKQLSDIRNIETLNDIKIIVKYGSQIYELKASMGTAPHKICVPLKTKWPYERIEINQAYDFNDYVRTVTPTDTTVTYNGNNAEPIEVYDSEKGENKVIGYYIDEFTNSVWKSTTDIQRGNRYHGDINSDDDITGIPYASSVRAINTLLDRKNNDGLPADSYEDVVITDNGGIQEGDEVLSRRKDLK